METNMGTIAFVFEVGRFEESQRLGILVAGGGFALFAGRTGATYFAIFLASLSAISNFRGPSANRRPTRAFHCARLGAWSCPSPRLGYAKRTVVASGFETVRPLDSTNVGGPNCGSGAASNLTIGPVYGPEKTSRLLEMVKVPESRELPRLHIHTPFVYMPSAPNRTYS